MPDDRWTELGIAPTEDLTGIRRAYAARLKTIDVDRDPAAFMRLRQAYEEAIDRETDRDAVARAPAFTSYLEPDERRADVATEVPLPAVEWTRYGALDAFRVAFETLVDEGHTREAVEALEFALAQGIVPLGGEAAFVTALAGCALTDPALAADELEAIDRIFGIDAVRDRAQALRWFARVEADAARGDGLPGMLWARFVYRATRIARAILKQKGQNLFSSDLARLRVEANYANRYARWLAGRIDAAQLERKVATLERTLRGHERTAVLLFVVIAILLVVRYFVK